MRQQTRELALESVLGALAVQFLFLGGVLPLASVRLTQAIPKNRIFDAMNVINEQTLTAPVRIGDGVVPHLLGYDCDVIVTKNVDKA